MDVFVAVIIIESHMRVTGRQELYKRNLWHMSTYVLVYGCYW